MPHILESTLEGRLQCQSPNHPPHQDRDTMYFLEERKGFMAFGCKVCTETHHTPQMHFLAVNRDAKTIYAATRKAEHIERNSHGTIISFR